MLLNFFYCFSKIYTVIALQFLVLLGNLNGGKKSSFIFRENPVLWENIISSLMKLRCNLGNLCVVNGGIDSSRIFVIILVVNPTGFRRKDKGEPI